MDPEERDVFKASRPALRRLDATAVDLPGPARAEADYVQHRSYRDFGTEPVTLKALADTLNHLRSITLGGRPKYLYASAGGMYPVQAYLYIKPGRVQGLDAGYYYHDPDAHRLVQLDGEDDDLRNRYDPIVNRPVFDSAAFAIFLIADLAAIGAMYRDRALHYAALETGHITQLLEMRAPDAGLGLCQTGGLETDTLRPHLDLSDNHLVLHGLLGGNLPAADNGGAANHAATTDERDEGEI